MNEMLSELAFPRHFAAKIGIWLIFATALLLLNASQLVLWWLLGAPVALLHFAAWCSWFTWQGVFFPLARERALQRVPTQAYRKVFFSHIWPGVSIGVAQMTFPVLLGVACDGRLASWPSVLAGSFVACLGLCLMLNGFRTIGLARAGFLTEYREVARPLVQSRIYSLMRHPLFVGGALLSLGGTCLAGDALALVLSLINLAILPIYQWVEDRRLTRVYGESYAAYCRDVGGVMPRLAHLSAMWRAS